MAEILKGAPVAAALNQKTSEKVGSLKKRGIEPTLAILRVGEREDDISYEKGASKRCDALGIAVKKVTLPADVEEEVFFQELEALNQDKQVHGILMFRPLPKHIDNEKARKMLLPQKDVDGCTDGSLAGVFTNTKTGFAPCTAQAVMEILDFYGIDLKGKNAAVLGRSLVVGRPLAMLLMHKNATPTICHTKTKNMPEIAKKADIVVACTGQMESIGKEFAAPGQVLIDVGIGWNEAKAKLCGDVLFEEAEPIVEKITPVPGGVGAVTTAVLISHVAEAAERANEL